MADVPPTPYKFSPEELRVLEECNRESFYQRSLPLSAVLGAGTLYAVKTGSLQPSARFGPTPKVFGAIIIGYLVGKLSYQTRCAEKIMALPHSELGAMLRRKRAARFGLPNQETLETEHPDPNSLYGKVPSSDFYSDVKPKSYMDIDTERPASTGLDDSFRPTVDDNLPTDFGPATLRDEELPPQTSQTTTFEELRKKNREEYEQKKTRPYRHEEVSLETSQITTLEELRKKNREEYGQRKTRPYRGVLSPDDVPAALDAKDYHSTDTWAKTPTAPPKNKYGDLFE